MEKLNYERDLYINEGDLDLEWLEQPSLFMKYARHLAEMRRNLDEEKQRLDIVRADLDKQIREHPEKFKIEKVTEGAIQSAILTEGSYNIAYKKYLDVKYEADMAQAAVQAFNQRKEALENLVKLNGQNYFASPSVPRDLTQEAQKRRKQEDTNKKVKDGLTRGGK